MDLNLVPLERLELSVACPMDFEISLFFIETALNVKRIVFDLITKSDNCIKCKKS